MPNIVEEIILINKTDQTSVVHNLTVKEYFDPTLEEVIKEEG